jgi:hypothetical protein
MRPPSGGFIRGTWLWYVNAQLQHPSSNLALMI